MRDVAGALAFLHQASVSYVAKEYKSFGGDTNGKVRP